MRKIASNKALTRDGVVDNPLIELDERGFVVRITQCERPDREPFTEHYAGLLIVGLDEALCKELPTCREPLTEWLPDRIGSLPTLHLVTGLDYPSLRPTPRTTLRLIR